MGIIPEDTCDKAMAGSIIVQQGCDRMNDIKAERPNVWPYSKATTGPIIVLRRYDPVRATQIMNKGTCNKTVTGRMI